MARILKLKDASSSWRRLISADARESIIQDDDNQTIAVVLPIEQYESYQAYLRQREADFAIFDEVAEAFKEVDPDQLQSRIDQAVDEVTAERNARRATG